MTAEQIVNGWKNADYRVGLLDESLPANPAGAIELTDPTLHPGGGTPGSGRNFVGLIHYVSQMYYCSAYGDNLWQQAL